MRKEKLSAFYKCLIGKLFLFSSENSINNQSSNFPFQALFGHWYTCFSAYLLLAAVTPSALLSEKLNPGIFIISVKLNNIQQLSIPKTEHK